MLYGQCKSGKGTPSEGIFKKAYINVKKFYRNKIKHEKLLANEKYIQNSQNKCKAAWNIIKQESCPSKMKQGKIIDSDTLNNHFINAACDINNSSGPKSFNYAINYVNKHILDCNVKNMSFEWNTILPKDVKKCVSRLSMSKSEDFHGLSNRVVNEIIHLIVEPLTYLFNFALEAGTYPQCLKITKIVPVFKKRGQNLVLQTTGQ